VINSLVQFARGYQLNVTKMWIEAEIKNATNGTRELPQGILSCIKDLGNLLRW